MNKRRLQHSIASASVVIILAAGSGLGKDISTNAGTSAFPFLKINVGARPVAMGGAFTGVADDESSLYYNPAGIAVFEEKRFIAGYHNYFVDMQSGFLGYVHSLNERQTLAFYVSYHPIEY